MNHHLTRLISGTILIAAATCIAATSSCSGNSSNNAIEGTEITDLNPQAYDLGREHARLMLEANLNENDLRDYLLDIQARATHFRQSAGINASESYLYGFRQHIIESGDTLASTLF